MRLNAYTGPLRRGEEDRKNKEKEQKASVKEYSWGETEIDQILRKVDDYNLSVEVKIERDKKKGWSLSVLLISVIAGCLSEA